MNPYECQIALRPRGAWGAMDVAVLAQRRWAGPILRLAAVVLGPFALAALPLCQDGWGPSLLGAVVLLWPLLQAPFVVLGGRAVFGRELGVRSVLADLWRQPGALVVLAAAPVAWALLSLVTLSLAGPPLLVAGLFLPEVLLLERQAPGAALGRAMTLAGRSMTPAVVGALMCWGLLPWGALGAEGLAQGLVETVFQLGRPLGAVADGEVTPFVVWGVLAVMPLSVLVRLMVYLDLRAAAEGWDLQVQLMAARG